VQLVIPEIPNNGKDISDFFLNGGTKTDFEGLIENIHKVAKFANNANNAKLDDEVVNFVDFANFAISPENGISDNVSLKSESILRKTPIIPEEVYDQLPKLLMESCSVFKNPRLKDLFLTSTLGVLSGCLPNIHGIYGGKKVYPNLYTFILAPPAQGKGIMSCAQDLGMKYHNYLLNKSKEAKKKFDSEMDNYLKSKNNNQESERPEKTMVKESFVKLKQTHSVIC
jgi:hypothetical protein